MKLPRYCVVGARPVKAVETPGGGMSVLAFDWDTGEFHRELDYLERVMSPDEETDVLEEDDFVAYVDRLRRERGLAK